MRAPKSFQSPIPVEERYAAQLRKIADGTAMIVRAFDPGDPAQLPDMERALAQYAEAIRPWARKAALQMLEDVVKRNERVWRNIKQPRLTKKYLARNAQEVVGGDPSLARNKSRSR